MENLFLEKNPFYILEVNPSDKRATIISKAEEKAFFTDSCNCEEAQARLLHPEKRLSAELDWFYDVSKDEISRIHKCISAKKEICTDGLRNISSINATLHNLSVTNYEDHFEIGYAILDVDEQYANIDIQSLLDVINACHKQAGIREVSQEEIERELNAKRDQIKQIVLAKVENISKENYVELATMISEKCIADDNYEDGVVISDVIDQYEIWANSILETKEEEIQRYITDINRSADTEIEKLVSELIQLVEEWDYYAQPLQVNMVTKGLEDNKSFNLAIKLRELAICLHNEKSKTLQALEIVEVMKKCFAEFPEVVTIIDEDFDTLQNLQAKKDEFEKNRELNIHNDKIYSVSVPNGKISIPAFCTCCMRPTRKTEIIECSHSVNDFNRTTTQKLQIKMPVCDDCLEHRKKHSKYLKLISLISIVAGIIVFIIMSTTKVTIPILGYLGLSSPIIVYYLLGALLKTKELSKDHSARGASVSIDGNFNSYKLVGQVHIGCPDVKFSFTNWEYAQLFQEANFELAHGVEETFKKNTAKSTSLLAANERPIINMLKMMGMFFLVLIVVRLFIGTNTNVSQTPSYQKTLSYDSVNSSDDDNSLQNDAEEIPSNESSYNEEVLFSEDTGMGKNVYADIVSIFPEMGIYTQGSSSYSSFVCKCETSTGTTVWVNMSVSEYTSNFDSTASSSIYNEYAEEITFSTSKKIHGTTKSSNSILTGLSYEIGATVLIDFESVN